MSEVIAIKTLNGHPLVDTEARAEIEALKENMGDSVVVILPETVLTVDGSEVPITTPLAAIPETGAMVKINYNGVDYASPVIFIPSDGEMPDSVAMGNTDAIEAPGGNADAPFAVVLFTESFDGMYGLIIPLEEVTGITISIVQESGASGGSGMFVVKSIDAIFKDTADGKMTYTLTLDKSYNAAVAAVMQGRQPVVLDITDLFDGASLLRLPACGVLNGILSFCVYLSGATYLCDYTPDGTATLTIG